MKKYNRFRTLLRILINPFISDYIVKSVSNDAPWLYFAYLPHVYRHTRDEEYMNSHQNLKETIKMVDVFNKLGYNVYLQHFTSKKRLPDINPDVVIGLEPNFNRACKKWPNSKKIYFATGAYWEHANKQIVKMTDYVNSTYCSNIKYNRMTQPHQASQRADAILQIGSSYTINTYPDCIRSKIYLIDQSSIGNMAPKRYAYENEFFFMASSGNVLKGVPLLLEFFSKHQEYVLNWVGPVEKDFKKAMGHMITHNIRCYGFVNVNSSKMKEIISKCNFLIYPSGTEGCPGAVLNSMKMGLIPIVTPWAAFDGIESVGYIMNHWDVESINNGVNWAISKTQEEIEQLSSSCIDIVNEKFTLDRFGVQLETFMKDVVNK